MTYRSSAGIQQAGCLSNPLFQFGSGPDQRQLVPLLRVKEATASDCIHTLQGTNVNKPFLTQQHLVNVNISHVCTCYIT